MTDHLRFFVPGVPAPQGSKRHVGRGVLVESSKALRPWRDSVAWAALDAATDQGWTGNDLPVAVVATFYLPRPKSAPKSRVVPAVRPDLDKLARALLDALTTTVLHDDGQVVDLSVRKVYATDSCPPGVRVDVYPHGWPS